MILGMAKLHLVIANILKIGSVIELKKLSIHDFRIERMVELWSNQIKSRLERLLIDGPINRTW